MYYTACLQHVYNMLFKGDHFLLCHAVTVLTSICLDKGVG